MTEWYDGYTIKEVGSVYNPNSVMEALRNHDFDSYWTATSAAENLLQYINYDYQGLSRTYAELSGGVEVPVDTAGFSNDLTTFRCRDDVLTLLIHLGYLSYREENGSVHIPNEELRQEFARALKGAARQSPCRLCPGSDP